MGPWAGSKTQLHLCVPEPRVVFFILGILIQK